MDIIPSFLMGPGQSPPYDGSFLNNYRLRVGEVQEVVYPSNKRSRSKKFIEYRVFVQHRENGTATTKMYENCVLMNLFGGFADKLTYTLRAEKTAGRKDSRRQPGEPGKGAKVLLLCANGESHSPIIIGGLREAATDKDPKDEKEKGHNLFFEFNGVAFEISHDGEVTLTVKGSTDEAGKPTKDVATDKLPSVVKIGKDGKITAQTKEGKNSIVIEQSGKVTVTSEKEVVVNTKKATITATDKCSVIAKIIELGGEGIGGLPPQGVVLGSHVDTFTGAPFFALGATSNTVFAKK